MEHFMFKLPLKDWLPVSMGDREVKGMSGAGDGYRRTYQGYAWGIEKKIYMTKWT